MSMNPQVKGSIPADTVRIAWAACPQGTLAMRLRDVLGELYQDEQFVGLYPVEGQPGYAPWRLAVVTVLQYTENLTDRQAANAVRERIDWKYSPAWFDRYRHRVENYPLPKSESQPAALPQQTGAQGLH